MDELTKVSTVIKSLEALLESGGNDKEVLKKANQILKENNLEHYGSGLRSLETLLPKYSSPMTSYIYHKFKFMGKEFDVYKVSDYFEFLRSKGIKTVPEEEIVFTKRHEELVISLDGCCGIRSSSISLPVDKEQPPVGDNLIWIGQVWTCNGFAGRDDLIDKYRYIMN